jgi:hypothetical protein
MFDVQGPGVESDRRVTARRSSIVDVKREIRIHVTLYEPVNICQNFLNSSCRISGCFTWEEKHLRGHLINPQPGVEP